MAHPSQDPVILIHGEAQTGKRSLLEGLAGNLGGLASPATLPLDTKYYSARARVHLTGGSHGSESPGQGVEAVLMVFDSTRESTFESLKAWAAEAEACSAAEIRLCIANRVDQLWEGGAVKRTRWMEAAYDWCTDNMYEYIEVAPRNKEVDACLEFEGEQQGLRRVVSALEAHMWPGLTMKDPAGAAPSSDTEREPLASTAAASPANGGAAPTESQDPRSSEAAPQLQPETAANGLSNGHHAEDGPGEDELERESDRFEALMSDMLGARSRLQDLPDEQRRAAAASLTMQMMAQFGLDEDDSESD